jgi:hypothetical protein
LQILRLDVRKRARRHARVIAFYRLARYIFGLMGHSVSAA